MLFCIGIIVIYSLMILGSMLSDHPACQPEISCEVDSESRAVAPFSDSDLTENNKIDKLAG